MIILKEKEANVRTTLAQQLVMISPLTGAMYSTPDEYRNATRRGPPKNI